LNNIIIVDPNECFKVKSRTGGVVQAGIQVVRCQWRRPNLS